MRVLYSPPENSLGRSWDFGFSRRVSRRIDCHLLVDELNRPIGKWAIDINAHAYNQRLAVNIHSIAKAHAGTHAHTHTYARAQNKRISLSSPISK